MVGLSFASVPLYRLFCKMTGYQGTTGVAKKAPDTISSREFVVEFNADVNADIPWSFHPKQQAVKVKVGQSFVAFYEAKNTSDKPVTGVAVYNVTPPLMGQYFQKVECFCFAEQLLEPNQSVTMPVSFFIDPAILKDKDLDGVEVVTLSYTFYKTKTDELKKAQDKQVQQEQRQYQKEEK